MNEGIDSLSFPEEEDPDWDLDEDEIEVAENGCWFVGDPITSSGKL